MRRVTGIGRILMMGRGTPSASGAPFNQLGLREPPPV